MFLLMRSGFSQSRRRAVPAALAALALALALAGAGCGGDDDDPATSGAASAPTQAQAPATEGTAGADSGADAPASPDDAEQERAGAASVEELYEHIGDAVKAGLAVTGVPLGETFDAAGRDEGLARVCDLMSAQAKRQTIVYVKRSASVTGVAWTCENATALLLRRARQSGSLKRSLRADVTSVDINRDRATVSVRFGSRPQVATIPLVKEDGEWKLAASPSGDAGR